MASVIRILKQAPDQEIAEGKLIYEMLQLRKLSL